MFRDTGRKGSEWKSGTVLGSSEAAEAFIFISQNSMLTSSQGDFLGGKVSFPRLLKQSFKSIVGGQIEGVERA